MIAMVFLHMLQHANVVKHQQQTGSGASGSPPLSATEEKVMAILGRQASEGIPGGIDTSVTDAVEQMVEESRKRRE